MDADLSRYARTTPHGCDVELLDDLTALLPHRRVDARAPRAALAAEQPGPPADQHMTSDPRSWGRVMRGVRARLAADVADLDAHAVAVAAPAARAS